MVKGTLIIWGAIVLVANLSTACDAKQLKLTDFLSQVRQSNPTLEAARARAQAALHRVGPVSTLDDLFFAVGVDQIPFGGGGSSVTRYQLSQTVSFPGKLSAKGDAAQGRADVAFADVETASRTLAIVATQVFLRTYFNHEALRLNEESRHYIRETIESTKARYKTGGASHHEWLLGKVELGVLEAERFRLEREQRSLHALVNELRNQAPEIPFEIVAIQFDARKEVSTNPKTLLFNQPELRAFSRISKSAQADLKVAKLSYAPDFVLQGMAMQTHSTDMGQPSNWGFMIGMNIPIFFWRKQSEQVAAAQAEQDAAEADQKSLENRLNTEVIDATEQLKTARSVVDLYKKDVIPLTEIAAKNAKTGYTARRLPLSQLVDTLKVSRIQHLELLAAQIDVELAKTRLENLLSSPPVTKFAPIRPTVFGGGVMGSMSEGISPGMSGTINMGSGMSGPTRRESRTNQQGTSSMSSSGMGNMPGGMPGSMQ